MKLLKRWDKLFCLLEATIAHVGLSSLVEVLLRESI